MQELGNTEIVRPLQRGSLAHTTRTIKLSRTVNLTLMWRMWKEDQPAWHHPCNLMCELVNCDHACIRPFCDIVALGLGGSSSISQEPYFTEMDWFCIARGMKSAHVLGLPRRSTKTLGQPDRQLSIVSVHVVTVKVTVSISSTDNYWYSPL